MLLDLRSLVETSAPVGTGAHELAPFGAAGTATETFTATASTALASFGVAATATERFVGVGTAALSPFAASATASERFTATAAAALSPFTAAGSAAEKIVGAVTHALASFSAAGVGSERFASTGSTALAPFGVAGTATEDHSLRATGSHELAGFGSSGTAAERFVGVGASALASFGAAIEAHTGFPGPSGQYRIDDLSSAHGLTYQAHPYQIAVTLAAHTLTLRSADHRRLILLATPHTLARIPTGDDIVIVGFTETIVLQCLAAGVAVDLSAWSSVKVQTSQDGRTWTDQTTTVTTAASGIVTAVLSSAVTGALTAPGLLKVRVSAVDGASKVRVFPDDADLYVTLRVQR